jgi:hypothetical protein
VPLECEFECARNDVYHAELNMAEARRRVVLSVLGDTEPGDVFYLADDPECVWWREAESCGYLRFDNECWFSMDDIGSGEPRQRVIVIHNTRKHLAKEST